MPARWRFAPDQERFSAIGFAACLVLAIVIGLIVRLPNLDESLWVDELHTAWAVEGSFGELIDRSLRQHQSPVYFVFPWLSRQFFGYHETALRLPSLLAGLAAIPLAGLIAANWSRSAIAGLLAAALVALDPHQIWFSLEARAYSLVQLVALAQVWVLWQTSRRLTWRWVAACVALSVLLFYLHYTAMLLLIAEAIWLAGIAAIHPPAVTRQWRIIALSCGVFALLALPGMMHLAGVSGSRSDWSSFISTPSSSAIWRELGWDIYLLPAIICLVAMLLVSAIALRRGVRRTGICYDNGLLLLSWLVLPVLLAWIVTVTGLAPLWLRRYFFGSAAAPMVAAGIVCGMLPRPWLRWLAAGVCLTTAVYLLGVPPALYPKVAAEPRHDEQWRQAVTELNETMLAGHYAVLVRSDYIESEGLGDQPDPELEKFLLAPVDSIYSLRPEYAAVIPLRSDPDHALTRRYERQLSQLDLLTVWVLGRGRPEARDATLRQVEDRLRENGLPSSRGEIRHYGNLWLVQFRDSHDLK